MGSVESSNDNFTFQIFFCELSTEKSLGQNVRTKVKLPQQKIRELMLYTPKYEPGCFVQQI